MEENNQETVHTEDDASSSENTNSNEIIQKETNPIEATEESNSIKENEQELQKEVATDNIEPTTKHDIPATQGTILYY
jgi:hypothetical protein